MNLIILNQNYYENNNIEHINSSARCPETNGQIESQHKTLQKFIKIALSEKKELYRWYNKWMFI